MNNYIERLILEGYDIFFSYVKPVSYIDHQNDPEYLEYEKALKNVGLSDLTLGHLGHVCWGPLSILGPHFLAYYMPKLVEFTVLGLRDKTGYPFMFRFVDLVLDGPNDKNFNILGAEQKEFILRVLYLLRAVCTKEFHDFCWDKDLEISIGLWEL